MIAEVAEEGEGREPRVPLCERGEGIARFGRGEEEAEGLFVEDAGAEGVGDGVGGVEVDGDRHALDGERAAASPVQRAEEAAVAELAEAFGGAEAADEGEEERGSGARVLLDAGAERAEIGDTVEGAEVGEDGVGGGVGGGEGPGGVAAEVVEACVHALTAGLGDHPWRGVQPDDAVSGGDVEGCVGTGPATEVEESGGRREELLEAGELARAHPPDGGEVVPGTVIMGSMPVKGL